MHANFVPDSCVGVCVCTCVYVVCVVCVVCVCVVCVCAHMFVSVCFPARICVRAFVHACAALHLLCKSAGRDA